MCPSTKQVQSCVVMLVWGCIVVDWQCRGSNEKAKIEGYTWVSDEDAHQQGAQSTLLPKCICDIIWDIVLYLCNMCTIILWYM